MRLFLSRCKWISAAAAAMLFLTSCSLEREDMVVTFSTGDETLLAIGDTPYPVSYGKIFLCNYQNIYGEVYNIDLWQHDFLDQDLKSYVKDVSISELARILSMDALAAEREIALTEREEENAQSAAKEYYATLNDAELSYTGITEEELAALYADYAVAQKLYSALTEGVNYEVSEDEARVMTVQEIYVTDEVTANLIRTALAEGTDFSTLAAQYNEGEQIEINIKRGDLPEEAENVVYAMDSGDVSDAVETGDGWYFFKCINKNVEELTAENKLVIAQEREKEASDDVYEAFVRDLDSTLNQDLWDSVEPDLSGDIETKTFFEVYDNHFR